MDRSLHACPGNPNPKRSWPKFSLLISVFLWMLAWEAIVWFVPVRPRVVISTRDLETQISEELMGFSPDGKMLVTIVDADPNQHGIVYHLWDVRTGQDLGRIGKEGQKLLPNVVYCGQRELLRETGFPFTVPDSYVVYDLTTRQETATIQIPGDVECMPNLCFSPDGRTFGYSTGSKHQGEFWLVEVATGRALTHLQGQQTFFDEHIFSPDGSTFATMMFKTTPDRKWAGDEKVIVLDAATGEIKETFEYSHLVRHPTFSSDGTLLAIKCWVGDGTDNRVEVLDLTTGKRKGSFKAEGIHQFLPDDKGFAMWDRDRVRFCDATGKQFAVTDVSSATYGPLSRGLDNAVAIPGTHILAVPSGHDWKPGFFFPWYTRLFGAKSLGKQEFESQLVFLDTRTGHKVAAIEVPEIDGAISPDGKTLALPMLKNDESIIEIWDIPPRKPLRWVLGLLAIPSLATLITMWRWHWLSRAHKVNREQ